MTPSRRCSGRRDDPAADALKNERTKILFSALAEIPEDLAEILVLRDLDGLAYEEIGLALGAPGRDGQVAPVPRPDRGGQKIRERQETRPGGTFASLALVAGAFV